MRRIWTRCSGFRANNTLSEIAMPKTVVYHQLRQIRSRKSEVEPQASSSALGPHVRTAVIGVEDDFGSSAVRISVRSHDARLRIRNKPSQSWNGKDEMLYEIWGRVRRSIVIRRSCFWSSVSGLRTMNDLGRPKQWAQ